MNWIKLQPLIILLLTGQIASAQLTNSIKPKLESTANKGHYCATDQLNSDLISKSDDYRNRQNNMNQQWQKYAIEKANSLANSRQSGNGNSTQAVYQAQTLPVIFHQMINGASSPVTSSLTKPQLQNALAALNALYAGTATGTKAAGLNTDIQFCLAEVDALGNAITSYTYTNPTSLPLDNTAQGQITTLSNAVQSTLKFPATKYINIYIVEDIVSPVAGFAYMPPAHGSSFDGIYIEAQYLLPATYPNDLAYNMTVLTHEMGHYLGLFHTFGICNPGAGMILPSQNCSCDNNNCLFNGDMVCDTPPDFSALPTSNCAAINTCTTDAAYTISAAPTLTADVNDLIENYMDYGDWGCQHSFTQGQANRMHFMIDELDGPRNSLLHSSACNTVCAGANCTVSIAAFSNTISVGGSLTNTVSLAHTLILNGASISHTFSANTCSGFYNTFNWQSIDLSNNTVIQTVATNTFNASFTTIGNYRIIFTSSVSGSNPLCFQTDTLDIQVLPPASCPTELDISGGFSTSNWQRIQYDGGWARTTNNGAIFALPTTTLTYIPSGPNTTGASDPFSVVSTLSADPTFSIHAIPSGLTNVMRVGRMLSSSSATLVGGDASYITYTFTPTAQNAKIRVYYLGMQEADNVSGSANGFQFATANAGGDKTCYGVVCSYSFTNVQGPPTIANRGITHTGSYNYTYPVNDMIANYHNFPGGVTTTTTVAGRSMVVMNGWQYRDLDFSEFVCASPTICLTFFARSDYADNVTPGFHHSYAYFGAVCMPANFHNVDLKLPNRDIACMADISQSCTKYNLPAPDNFNSGQMGNYYFNLLDVDVEESDDNVAYTPTSTTYQTVFSGGYSIPTLELCKSPDNHPYKYYRIIYRTLCQTLVDTVTIFQGFVHNINDCAPNPMSGGSFINPPVVIGTHTVSSDQYVHYCTTTTLSLTPPCWWQAGDPAPVYQWQKNSGGWIDLPGETNSTLNLNANAGYNICMQYRRRARYHDIYCNNDTWIPSDVFSVTLLSTNNVAYTTVGTDVCVNDPATVSLNNVYEANPFSCDIELAAQTATTPVVNSFTVTFYSNANCIPSNSITAISGPSVLTYTYSNNLTTPLNIPFTFNNTMFTSNDYVRAVFQFNRYGCALTFTASIPIKVKPSATAGTITTSACLSPTVSITGNNTNPTGYEWQYSYNSTFTPTISLSASTLSSVAVPAATFTAYPVYVRRVAKGTIDCPNVAYSNTLTITNNTVAVTATASPSTICAGGSSTLTASGATSYTWTAPTTTNNPTVVTPGSTTIYTVTGANADGCTATTTVAVNVNPTPTVNISTSTTTMCVGSTKTLTASGATNYTWSASPAFTSTANPVTISPTVTTIYTLTGETNGCVSTKTISITVNSGVGFSVSVPSASVCPANCETLTASGVSSYTWLPSNTTGNTSVVCPTVATTYTVLGLKAGSPCPAMQTITIGMLPVPTITISGATSFCAGSTTTLTATPTGGGISYIWQPAGVWTNTMVTGAAGIHSVTATNSVGCSSTKTINLTYTPLATVYVSTSTNSICPGGSAVVTASGTAVIYTWNPGNLSGSTVTLSPASTTVYTVTGTARGRCPSDETFTITVLPTPTVSITGSTTICPGSTTTLTANGTGTYSWSTGVTTNTAAVSVNGPVSVTLTTVDGCTAVATTTVNYGSLSPVSISASSSTLCAGACATLTCSGPTSYTWSPGGANTSTLQVCPGSTSSYTVRGIKGTDCANTATITITVIPAANITGNLTICYNTTTLTATGGGTYSWSPGGATTSTLLVSTTGVKTVTVTNSGCVSVKSVTITQPGPPQCYNPGRMSNNSGHSDDPAPVKNNFHDIYPNPTSQSFSIAEPEEINEVEIFDYTGKLLQRINKKDNAGFENINVKHYASGIYMIRVISDNNDVELFRLIKE